MVTMASGLLTLTLPQTTNDTHTVSKLPYLPLRLQTESTVRQHGAIYSDMNSTAGSWALTLTHSHAIVWPYTEAHSPKTFEDTYEFELENTRRNASDLLPLGSLVMPIAADSPHPGLIVVMPNSGEVTYWTDTSEAKSRQFMKQDIKKFTIPNMGSDAVTQILNAELAGFILGFRSGKIAYLGLKDASGRPAITFQYLGSGGPRKGGLFGSIRGFLPSMASYEEIAAIRAGPPQTDNILERTVVMATTKGRIQSWHVQRGGFASLHGEADGREAIVTAMKETQPSLLSNLLIESFEILDLTYSPKPATELQLLGQNTRDDWAHLHLLVSLSGRDVTHYSLIEVALKGTELVIRSVRPIKSYTTPVSRIATSRPRLYLPDPALVAYAVFDRAVVVVSMAKQPDSPESQLRAESHILPKYFEDVIDFREDMNVEIVGSGLEEPHGTQRSSANHPAAVLLVRGSGVIRIAATGLTKLTSIGTSITARSKLDQAVFFGNLDNNPISFKVRPELELPADEVGTAALELSLDILKSEAPQLRSIPASIDTNLSMRAAALRSLIEYLQITGVELDRTARWQLLWNAEKIEAASLVWKNYDAKIKVKPPGRRRGLLADIIDHVNENKKTNPVAEAGELDSVRHWFANDISEMGTVILWATQIIKYTYREGQSDDEIGDSISDSNDIIICALEGAFEFRTAQLNLYGLHDETLEHGVLQSNNQSNYQELPEFWTSTTELSSRLNKQALVVRAFLENIYPVFKSNKDADNLTSVRKILIEFPRLLDLIIRSNTERYLWASSQSSPGLESEIEDLKQSQIAAQHENITNMPELDLVNEAIDLAEKHQLMPTLAAIMLPEILEAHTEARRQGLTYEMYKLDTPKALATEQSVGSYFRQFGDRWANAFYELCIHCKAMSTLMLSFKEHSQYLTAFLRKNPKYAKIAWLNEAIQERNFDEAANGLLKLGLHQERDLWSKKIELSIGKLAHLAGQRLGKDAEIADVRGQLGLIEVQNQVFQHVSPTIEVAIDDAAELQLALESHGNRALKKSVFASLLQDGLSRLIRHDAMDALTLVDLTTLMNGNENISDEQYEFRSQQFYLALEALKCGALNSSEQRLVQRIIWRRCMLRDKWDLVNDTADKLDEEVSNQLRTTTLYLTYRACYKNRKSSRSVLLGLSNSC